MATKNNFTDKQALTLAMQEMNEGLPAGAYAEVINQLRQPAEAAAQTDSPASWADAIAQLGAPTATPTRDAMNQDWTEAQAIQQMQDEAQSAQDRRLAQVFGLPTSSNNRLDTDKLPPAVDRYIEKILAS